jgi:hypothetical protein
MGIKERIDEKLLPHEAERFAVAKLEADAKLRETTDHPLYERVMFNRRRKELFIRLQAYGILDLLEEMTGPIDLYTFPIKDPEYGKWNWQEVLHTETHPKTKILISHNGISSSRRGNTLEVIQVQFDEDEILKIAGGNIEFNEPVHQALRLDEGLQEKIEEAFAEAFISPRLAVEESYSPIEARDDHWQSFDKFQPKPAE